MAQLEGKWIKILEVRHYGDGVDLTPANLLAMVRNYKNREEDAPLGVGLNSKVAPVLGSIGDLRREGGQLKAQIGRVSPQLERFHAEANGFPKVAVAIKKTSSGPSLQRVGFLREDGSHPRVDREAPRVDAYGNDEVVFSENSQAARAVKRLKAAGLWRSVFDDYCFVEFFEALESSDALVTLEDANGREKTVPVMGSLVRFIEVIAPFVNDVRDGPDADLHSAAKIIQRERGMSYCEAVTLAERRRGQAAQDVFFSEHESSGRYSGAGLHREARRLADERSIPYGEALDEVIRERPDLAEEGSAPLSNDAEWLRSLRIAPDLEATDGS